MKKHLIYISLFSLSFISCEEVNLNNIVANQFVIEAFLYAGEPIDDIRVKTSFSLLDTVDTSIPINTATVTLIKNARRYVLMASGDDGFYHYPNQDLTVNTGDVFQLEVIYNSITATAETTVPTPTSGLRLSLDSLKVPQLPFTSGREAVVEVIGDFMRTSRIEATWDNPNQDFYFMIVESVKDSIDPIFPSVVIDALARFRFVSEPTEESALTFFGGTLVSFGQYSVKVYHINKEYTALYENREQDSRDLNEPPSNVKNALGVFSAFNSENAFFEVVRE